MISGAYKEADVFRSGTLERRFQESRRKAYYLMSIHEHLPPQARKQLKEVGWAKGIALAKLARRDRQNFDCATWLHKARQMPKEDFNMLGSDRSRGYCLDEATVWIVICADFLAGANPDLGDPEMLLLSMTRFFRFLPEEQRQAFLGGPERELGLMSSIGPDPKRLRLDKVSYEDLRQQSWLVMVGGVNPAARCRTWKFTTKSFAAIPAMTPTRI